MGIDECRLISLPRMASPRGNLTYLEGSTHVPFEIRRVYYIYDVPGGESRGQHAHRHLQSLIIAASGSFDVIVRDEKVSKSFCLNRSYQGLYLPPMMWREIADFSSGSVCLVLASEAYDEADYIRDWDEYVAARIASATRDT